MLQNVTKQVINVTKKVTKLTKLLNKKNTCFS